MKGYTPVGWSLSTPIILLFCFFLFSPIYSYSQKTSVKNAKLNIAVLDFDARMGIGQGEAATLSDVLNSELVKSNEFIVVDRNRIKSILSEQGFQQSEACSEVECVVEAGKILKVEKMFVGVVGSVGKILKVEKMFVGVVGSVGKMYNVGIQVVDVATAQIEKNISRQHSGDIEELVTDVIPQMAAQLIQEMTGKEMTTGSSTWYYYVGAAVLVGGSAAYFLLKPKEETKEQPTVQEDLPTLPALP